MDIPQETSADVIVKAADMSEERQATIIDICREALLKYTVESEVAAHIKKGVEAIDSPTWHCVVGVSFGSYVAHTRDHFLHLKIRAPKLQSVKDLKLGTNFEWCNILIFKTA